MVLFFANSRSFGVFSYNKGFGAARRRQLQNGYPKVPKSCLLRKGF